MAAPRRALSMTSAWATAACCKWIMWAGY
jgi:hypothetical protein